MPPLECAIGTALSVDFGLQSALHPCFLREVAIALTCGFFPQVQTLRYSRRTDKSDGEIDHEILALECGRYLFAPAGRRDFRLLHTEHDPLISLSYGSGR